MRDKTSAQRLQSQQRAQQRASWRPPEDAIVLHSAYGTGANAFVEGRVIDYQERSVASATDRKRVNLRRNLGLLMNDERSQVPVHLQLRTHVWESQTDAEGYFRIELQNLAALPGGWHRIEAFAGDASDATNLLMVPPENTHGIISDVDDTLLITEVGSRRRMLINTLLHNPLQRRVFSGLAERYHRLAARNPVPATAPIFYLSATPRQLHLPLQAILEHNRFPPGVLITKRLTNDATSEPLRDQFTYKTRKIEQILERLPHVTFTLIGDNAERDPEVFEAIRSRHPQRIAAVWIRRVHADATRVMLAGQGDIETLLREMNAP